MKKISLGLVLGAIGFSNAINPPNEDGASILINWSNNKGEKKVFKVDDIEKDLGNQKIHSKTLLQKYVKTSRAGCSRSKSCGKRSCSKGSIRGRSCSGSHGGRSCSKGSYGGRSCSKGSYGGRSCSKGSYGGRSCSVKSNSCSPNRNTFVLEHRPVYSKNCNYRPLKRQNRYHNKDDYCRSISKNNSLEKCYDKDYDKRSKKLNLQDLIKLYKLNKNSKLCKDSENRSLSKSRKNKEFSKYSNDKDSKHLKTCKERSCSNVICKNDKRVKSDKDCKTKNKEADKCHEKEFRDCHNLVNMNDKKNEALLMKEKDKDNLHSSDRCIEEFDKLEHFKKVEERCRSASKARHAKCKKNECMDKNQKEKAATCNKEVRANNKMKMNKHKDSNSCYDNENNCLNKNSKYLKDDKCLDASCDRERSLCKKAEKETCDDNSYKYSLDKSDHCDLKQKECDHNKYCKDKYVNDDCDYYKKKRGDIRDNEHRICEKDKFFNDKDCNIC